MHCESLWLKASAKCINVNVTVCKYFLNKIHLLEDQNCGSYYPVFMEYSFLLFVN